MYPELYHAATPVMAEHNALMCDSQVTAQLRKAFPPREGRHFWFKGAIEPKLATDLYVSANSFYDFKSGTMKVEHTGGKMKGTTTLPGFSTYEHHLGSRAELYMGYS